MRRLTGLTTAIPLAAAAVVLAAPAAGQCEITKVTAADSELEDWFGGSCWIEDDLLVVGCHGGDDACPWDYHCNSGAVYLYQRDLGGTSNWGQLRKLTAADHARDDNYGISVGMSGGVLLVGARGDDGRAGAAYVHYRDQGGANSWGQFRKIVASDAKPRAWFGHALGLDGDTAVIGAYGNNDACPQNPNCNSGSAYIVQRHAGGPDAWGEVKKLLASDAFTDDRFGTAVAISGDTVIIGAPYVDDGGFNAGAVYIFERNEGGPDNWGELTKIVPGDLGSFAQFGASVAIDGDTAVVGAYKDASNGSVYIFERDAGGPNNWGQVTKLTETSASTNDEFGYGVAVQGDTVVVGARWFDDACQPFDPQCNSGAAFVYQRDAGGPGAWGRVAKLVASDAMQEEQYGWSAAIDGELIGIGARKADIGNHDEGAAYLYDLPACLGIVRPESYAIVFGRYLAGSVEDLHVSDDARLQIQQRPAASPLLPVIRIAVNGAAAQDAASEIGVTMEAHVTSLPGQPLQKVSLFDYDAAAWQVVDERTATLTDSVVEVVITDDPGRFIEAGGNAMSMRIDWFDPGNVIFAAWGSRIDQAVWVVIP